ncbi:hypothetical protein [Chryseobacterium sp.]|uniref:hypothetical protein n=1 Tax=Chryseobacterium sp. TaxID=1871047 RepID=UPI0031D71C43
MRLLFIFIFTLVSYAQAQDSTRQNAVIEVKPAVGATGTPMKPTLSVAIFYPVNQRFLIVSHSVISFLLTGNSPEFIKINYNYTFSHKLGMGYSLYGKKGKSRHSLFALGGIKHIAFKETMENPDLDKITVRTQSTVADYGLMYEFSLGKKRYTFDTRLYFPLSPIRYYPQGTLSNLVYVEMGIGIKLYR